MDIDEFWKLIDTTREASGGDASKQAQLLVKELVKYSVEEIFSYKRIMDDLLDRAYDAALWDAADIIGCGCGDDDFLDFRAWLISRGRGIYDNALIDPESLVDLIDVDETGKEEEMLYGYIYAYEQKTGQEIPPSTFKHPSPVLKGESWSRENRPARFPKLAAKFGDCKERWRKWLTEDLPSKS